MNRIAILLVIAILQLLGGVAAAESWSKRLTQSQTSDQMYSFTIKAVRLESGDNPAQVDDKQEFLEFHVTVKPVATAEQLQQVAKDGWRPKYSGELRVLSGKVFVSACRLEADRCNAELSYSFQIAPEYLEKSTFTFAVSESGIDDRISYWFHLKDFIKP